MSGRRGLLVALLAGPIACAPGAATGPTLTFGAIFPEIGSLGTSGQLDLLGPRLAVAEINAAGGVLGRPVALAERNDNSDPATGVTIAHELVDQLHVPAILGPLTSRVLLAIWPITVAAQVVMISGDATSPEISSLPANGFIFRTVGSDNQQAGVLFQRARAHGFHRMAVIHEPGPYGTDLGGAFAANFTNSGGTITDMVAYQENQQSYRDLLAGVYQHGPEAILLVAFPNDGAQVIKDYVTAFAFEQTFWFFTDGVQDPSFVTSVGASNFTFQHEATGPGMAESAFTTFEKAHRAMFGIEPAFSAANNYDAAYVLALATVQAGRFDGAAIRDNMRMVANAPGMTFGPGQFAEAAAAIQAGIKIKYAGASGSLDFDEHGDPTATYVLWQVQAGQIVILARGLTAQ